MNAPVAHPMLHHWPVTTLDTLHQALWTAAEIASATAGIASHDFQASGVEMDSRDVKPGDVFVALKGEAMDGHRFIDAAFAKGAVAAITDRPVDYPHVLVEEPVIRLLPPELAHREHEGVPRGEQQRHRAFIGGQRGIAIELGFDRLTFGTWDDLL